MSNSKDYREVAHASLGILGNVASCLFFLSSAPTILRILKCKSIGGLSGNLYVFKLFNCMLWALYGLPFVHPHDVWVVLTNAMGCIFASMYIFPYLFYATAKERFDMFWKLCVVVLSFGALVVLLILLDKSQQHRIMVVGIMSTIVSSGMHITLLSQCGMAIESKDKKYLHPNASIAAFIKGAVWTAYALVNFDIFILVPNGLGVMIGLIQAMIILLFIGNVSTNLESYPEEKGPRRNSLNFAEPYPEEKGLRRHSLNFAKPYPEEKGPRRHSLNLDSQYIELLHDATTQLPIVPLTNVSRFSCLLPRQANIPSNIVVPIDLDHNIEILDGKIN